MDINDPAFDRRPGESDQAYVDRCEALVWRNVEARLGSLSGDALAQEAERMRQEMLASGPPHRRHRDRIVRCAYREPGRIPHLIQELQADPQGVLEADPLTAAVIANGLIAELQDIQRASAANDDARPAGA